MAFNHSGPFKLLVFHQPEISHASGSLIQCSSLFMATVPRRWIFSSTRKDSWKSHNSYFCIERSSNRPNKNQRVLHSQQVFIFHQRLLLIPDNKSLWSSQVEHWFQEWMLFFSSQCWVLRWFTRRWSRWFPPASHLVDGTAPVSCIISITYMQLP